ncbi:MAG: hypothetical protein K2J95_00340 [Lachnospiraceae bacterium]|nr:hypothetical protein [Lachnospiraceae bacterium]
MAKKKGNMILWGLVIGAATAGVYHYLQNKQKAAVADEFDDFDNFEDAADDTQAKDRHYIPLNLDNAKAFVSDTFGKAKEAVSKVSRKLQKEDVEDDVIIDDIFDDLKESAEGTAEEAAENLAADSVGSTDSANAKAPENASTEGSSTTEDFFDDEQ